jgi:hypothetical protein
VSESSFFLNSSMAEKVQSEEGLLTELLVFFPLQDESSVNMENADKAKVFDNIMMMAATDGSITLDLQGIKAMLNTVAGKQ